MEQAGQAVCPGTLSNYYRHLPISNQSSPLCFHTAMASPLKRFLAIALPLLLAACAGGMETHSRRARPGFTAPAAVAIPVDPSPYAVHGVDVSKYQGDIDWQAAAQGGVQFAWIKSTEGADHLDENFARNWRGAAEAGIPRGAYHFAFWCRTPAEQMRWFQQNVPVDEDALPPVLDVELTPTSKTCTRSLYREEVLREMREMLEMMERHYGKRPVIYSTVDFYQGILHSNALDDYPIWVRSTKYEPKVKYGNRKWHFWQYQSDGRVPGINAKVDRNAFYGTRRQWDAFLTGK